MDTQPELGIILRGSLAEGMEMRLSADRSVEDVRAGKFVVIEGAKYRFFSMITNVLLGVTNPQVLLNPPSRDQELHRRVLEGTGTFGTVELRPMLMIPRDGPEAYSEEHLLPVKSIPSHFSPVAEASPADVNRIFGEESDDKFFTIGAPLDMDDAPVCLNLDRFVERSNAIFGKSGTGKTFLTRLCLCGTIKQNKAVNLVFDMHSEYGWKGTSEGVRSEVRGLKQFFHNKVQVFTLDPDSSRRRGAPVEFEVRIPYTQITVEDILLLQRELNLNPTAVETAYLLVNRFGNDWLARLLEMDADTVNDFANESGGHAGSLAALKRKLERLATDCQGFLKTSLPAADDAVTAILGCLESGRHVVLEFGQYTKPVQYMLVVNILTRRIHEQYVRKTEEALARGGAGRPVPLVITIEEAHKFLAPSLAGQTIFGTIAREMRKYNVTLLIVDQRPSGIDDEVLSQVGTKLICLLDDEKDIDAVLAGTSNARGLRGVLASLESKQQALILGHAVPMPVVIKTRTYDDDAFKAAMGLTDGEALRKKLEKDRDLDFPE
jgi:DNA helicase HerA-like ATPase